MLSEDELRAAVAAREIDTVVVAFPDVYGRLLGKRFDAGFYCAEVIVEGTHACDYLLTADMEMEPVPGYRFASWDRGYGDVHLVPDPATLRRAAWAERTAIVLCDLVDSDHQPVAISPRAILRRQIELLGAHGLEARAASELEFFVYRDTYREIARAAGALPDTPANWYVEDYHLLSGARVEDLVGGARRALGASGIAVEGSKGEWGRGQHEINIRYSPVLEMADRHALVKHGVKELADRSGMSVTFMAKPNATEAGSSSHLHLSLWRDGQPVFADDHGQPSDLFRWFLGGWLAHVDDVMACYAPTVNSYKRYVDLSWAPTRVAWSYDNRTAGFRVVGKGASLRIENRIPGADCNPYLAYAASLACGVAGIERRIEPPAEFVGDVYQSAELPRVPRTLEHAAGAFRDSEFSRTAFGDEVVDHYAHFFDVEVDAFHSAVTDWERARYFERI